MTSDFTISRQHTPVVVKCSVCGDDIGGRVKKCINAKCYDCQVKAKAEYHQKVGKPRLKSKEDFLSTHKIGINKDNLL
jgi:hypothetical protein